MKLRSLRLQGFKSFADRTTLEFREGVTAIVGSNGCGKSNIADSVRWVLGEQRASAMRGAKMEEVIFQGTARRRALNFAEVSLLFENDRGRVPIPQTEIEVSRKVFREGGSEYSLNRESCRLRDIHGILRDTGLGSNAYAIIEAGMIETLLSDRAEERRALFEEAAGIGKYKDSRQAALRRLESAEGDLARLDDLIAEVETKVRSLSRQRRRAERHAELQARRLDLELAIAQSELTALDAELIAGERRHSELDQEGRQGAAERATAEALTEERRIEAGRLGQERVIVAGRLERVRSELDSREREVLLANERRTHSELRITQLVREREELVASRERLTGEIERAREEWNRQADALAAARERLQLQQEENQSVRAALAAERERGEAAAARARDLAREIATAEAERAGMERTRRESEERLRALDSRDAELQDDLEQLSGQTDLWSARADEVRTRLEESSVALERFREEVQALRAASQTARDALTAAEDRLSRLDAQLEAREALERSYGGFSPAVTALMAERSRFPAVIGPLADFVATPDDESHRAAVEAYLGPLLQALVVRDLAAARELRLWFREEWTGGGSLLLLPLDAPHRTPLATTGLRYGTSEGGAWVDQLLAGLVVASEDPLAEHVPGVARVGPGGELVDARGVVRLPESGSGEGILARRQELNRLREKRKAAETERDARLAERDSVLVSLAEAEERVHAAEEARRIAEAERQRVELDNATFLHQRGRLQDDREAVAQALASIRESGRKAAARMAELEARLAELTREIDEANEQDASVRLRLNQLEGQWEELRDRESELRVMAARAEADLRDAERRATEATQALAAAEQRMNALEREAAELRSALEGLSGVSERAGGEIEELFRARDRETAELALLDARLAEVDSELAELGERSRTARRRESAIAEERHQIELRLADLRSRVERVRERLEVEWGRPWSALLGAARPVGEGEIDEWRAELRETTVQLEGLGAVNMLAVEEHGEEDRRLTFLLEQRTDLVKARDDLGAAIRQINRTARDLFMETFDAVRDNFRRTFQSLFQGGECDVWLADPDDPLESLVEIQASPKGKKTQRIHLLSGGERTLTALALLFAIYLVKPSPFCVLDEVDAPLDDSNVERFLQLLHDFKSDTQFIVITHNPRTMEAADWVYGVTMEEPGVSTIVGVELLGAWEAEGRVA